MSEISLLDRRIHALREDFAAQSLYGQVEAARFVAPLVYHVSCASLPVFNARNASLGYETEWLMGEEIEVYDQKDGWVFAQAKRDHYVGFVELGGVQPNKENKAAPTHRVASLRGFVYPQPSIKHAPLMALPYGARLVVLAEEGRFSALAEGGYIFSGHLSPLDVYAPDFVAEAERFIGIPYLWGGKTSWGIDCSGLVQVSCQAAGIEAPRDSDMQEAALGEEIIHPQHAADFLRGDLLFWPGHVAIAQGGGQLLHANAWSMSVLSEDLASALTRIHRQGHELRKVKRMR